MRTLLSLELQFLFSELTFAYEMWLSGLQHFYLSAPLTRALELTYQGYVVSL